MELFLGEKKLNGDFCQRSRRAPITPETVTVCNPMDHSLSGSSVHGIFQARILEWLPFPVNFGDGQNLESLSAK